jgi:hypothetical protein
MGRLSGLMVLVLSVCETAAESGVFNTVMLIGSMSSCGVSVSAKWVLPVFSPLRTDVAVDIFVAILFVSMVKSRGVVALSVKEDLLASTGTCPSLYVTTTDDMIVLIGPTLSHGVAVWPNGATGLILCAKQCSSVSDATIDHWVVLDTVLIGPDVSRDLVTVSANGRLVVSMAHGSTVFTSNLEETGFNLVILIGRLLARVVASPFKCESLYLSLLILCSRPCIIKFVCVHACEVAVTTKVFVS